MAINNGSPFLFLLETSYDEEGKLGKFQQRKTEKIAVTCFKFEYFCQTEEILQIVTSEREKKRHVKQKYL